MIIVRVAALPLVVDIQIYTDIHMRSMDVYINAYNGL